MTRFLIRLVGTMLGIWVSTRLVPGIEIAPTATLTDSVLLVAGIALVFTLVNSIIMPVVRLFTFPLYVLTFGLFALVTNSLMFALTGWLSTAIGLPLYTGGFFSCLFGALVTAFCSWLTVALAGRD